MSLYKQAGFMFVIAVAAAIAVVVVNNRFFDNQPDFVAVDLNHLMSVHIEKYGALAVDEEKRSAISNAYVHSLERVLERYREQGFVIFVKPAIVNGATDITDNVKAEVEQLMDKLL